MQILHTPTARCITNTCLIVGISARAISPNTEGLIGTSRHAGIPNVSWVNSSLIISIYSLTKASSRGKKICPTPKIFAKVKPLSAATARKKLSGICKERPQPSPVLPSAKIAPRCCIRDKPKIPLRTTLWLCTPSILAIKPNPQFSRSNELL
ncbi:hypothetical protein HAPS_2103 [Glaesserella parasuis SH0165]|uniref:Uncharacterized protein n=1 Tax=Glaesserella parasuis serovar 5 (strain SH0165) TaxID=557723 RepID=B8F8A2_GLAP5|nr:hypothetical protein HAPS_2103 [Glaesserella parasuis SH0165]